MQNVWCDYIIDYFNGELDSVSKKKFEEHLNECDNCREEWEELTELTEHLPYLTDPVEPPIGMKKRVLDDIFSKDSSDKPAFEEVDKRGDWQNGAVQPPSISGRKWVMPALAASLLFSLLGNGYLLFNKDNSQRGVSNIYQTNKVYKALELDSAVTGSNAKVTAIMIEQERGLALVVQGEQLAQPEGAQVYQVWLIEDGKKYRAGTFIPNEKGEGAVAFPVTYEGDHNWEMIAITLEPSSTSEQPQGNIMFSSEL